MVTSGPVSVEDNSMDVVESSSNKFELIKTLLNEAEATYPQRAGETWYIVSARWYAQLKKHLEDGGGNETTNPGAINNEDIIQTTGGGERILKSSATEKQDFEFFNEKLWNMLVSTFGLQNDQTTLIAKVYASSNDDFKIEPRPLAVECCLYPNIKNTMRTIRVSRSATIPECQDLLLQKFGLKPDVEHRLWLFSPDGELELPPPADNKTVNDLDLTIQHIVIVEIKQDGEFPLDDNREKDEMHRDLKDFRKIALDEPKTKSKYSKSENGYSLRSGSGSAWSTGFSDDDSQESGTGLQGLGNLGNTCFMNSSIQCLSNVPELTEYFLSRHYEQDINLTNPLGKKGEIAREYANLINQLWGKDSTVHPYRFKGTLSRYSSLFNGSQQDAQESLQFIVDCLHEDLNRVAKKPYIPQEEDTSGKSDQQVSDESWEKTLKRDDSIIVDLFHGQIRSTVKCPDCSKVSVTFDPVCYYQLPLPSTQTKKLMYTYVPYEGRIAPSRHRVDLPKTATLADFYTKVSSQQDILAVDMYNNQATMLNADKLVDDITRDNIVVFKLAKSKLNEDFEQVIVYLLRSSDSSKKDQQRFAPPFVLSLPVKGMSAKKLYGCIFTKLMPLMSIPGNQWEAEEVTVSGDEDHTSDQENGMDIEDSTEKEESDPLMNILTHVPPNLFTVATINSYGTSEIKQIKMSQREPVTFPRNRDGTFLAVNFMTNKVNALFKKDLQLPASDSILDSIWGKNNDSVELRDCFQLYISPEKLGENNKWRCPRCKEEKQALKKLDLWRMPKYMIVHLKRFQYTRFYRQKISTKVRFPVRDFDLSDLVINPKERPALYDVVAISCHSGGLGGGHYWAICQNDRDKKWYKFDDSRVAPVTEKDLESDSSPYIILFRRRKWETIAIPSAPMETKEVEDIDQDEAN